MSSFRKAPFLFDYPEVTFITQRVYETSLRLFTTLNTHKLSYIFIFMKKNKEIALG
jgi:hypothetical protein